MRSKLFFLALSLMVAGCGYKGPLYLPGQKPVAGQPAPGTSPETVPAPPNQPVPVTP